MSEVKTYTIFAGVNGAGKTTLYKSAQDDFGIRVNADEILKNALGGDWQDQRAQLEAGLQAVRMIKDCLKGSESFNQETTLSGKDIISNIKKAKENGFRICLYYVGLENAELSVRRVAIRVKRGGHGIPRDVLLRRYEKSLKNLETILPFCDEIKIFNNSVEGRRGRMMPVLFVKDREVMYLHKQCPEYLRERLTTFT